jgi:hypothetical protein
MPSLWHIQIVCINTLCTLWSLLSKISVLKNKHHDIMAINLIIIKMFTK